jgi:hypothetical protein
LGKSRFDKIPGKGEDQTPEQSVQSNGPGEDLMSQPQSESATLEIMFPTVATVTHIQRNVENKRFHAKAEVTLSEDFDQVDLQLKDVDDSVFATSLVNAKAGVHFFFINGEGEPPFKVRDTIGVYCFRRGEMP